MLKVYGVEETLHFYAYTSDSI